MMLSHRTSSRADAPSNRPSPLLTPTVVDRAAREGDLTGFVLLLNHADLLPTLAGAGPFTVFAATDDAFAEIAPQALSALMQPKNRARLQNTLKRHVVEGLHPARDLQNGSSLPVMHGRALSIESDSEAVKIGPAHVLETNLRAGNGVVHTIDRVLLLGSPAE